jgi:hypothetical protein
MQTLQDVDTIYDNPNSERLIYDDETKIEHWGALAWKIKKTRVLGWHLAQCRKSFLCQSK